MKHWKTVTAFITVVSLVALFFNYSPEKQNIEPEIALGGASNVNIRQEINILDRYYSIPASTNATSSEKIFVSPNNYSGTVSYYLEVIASTSVALSNTIYLQSSDGTRPCSVSIPNPTTSWTLIRGTS